MKESLLIPTNLWIKLFLTTAIIGLCGLLVLNTIKDVKEKYFHLWGGFCVGIIVVLLLYAIWNYDLMALI